MSATGAIELAHHSRWPLEQTMLCSIIFPMQPWATKSSHKKRGRFRLDRSSWAKWCSRFRHWTCQVYLWVGCLTFWTHLHFIHSGCLDSHVLRLFLSLGFAFLPVKRTYYTSPNIPLLYLCWRNPKSDSCRLNPQLNWLNPNLFGWLVFFFFFGVVSLKMEYNPIYGDFGMEMLFKKSDSSAPHFWTHLC